MNTNQAFLLVRELAAKREHVLDKNQIAVAVALVDLVERVTKLEEKTDVSAAAAAFHSQHQSKLEDKRKELGVETWLELKAERDALKIERDALREDLIALTSEVQRHRDEKAKLRETISYAAKYLRIASNDES